MRQSGLDGNERLEIGRNALSRRKAVTIATPQGYARLDELISTDLAEVLEFPTSGVSFFQSNLVTTSANYNDGTHGAVTGLTALRTYIFGRDGLFSINLGAPGDTGFGDGEWRNILDL